MPRQVPEAIFHLLHCPTISSAAMPLRETEVHAKIIALPRNRGKSRGDSVGGVYARSGFGLH
jgi:hypothetical protein